MSPRVAAPPPQDAARWRKALARAHPDAGGNHELFVWLTNVRGSLGSDTSPSAEPSGPPPSTTQGERVPFDESLGYVGDFPDLTLRALSIGRRVEDPHRTLLGLLIDCTSVGHGRRAARQCRGATYKQLAYAAHLARMSKAERSRWYELARAVPLSEAHPAHVIDRRKADAYRVGSSEGEGA